MDELQQIRNKNLMTNQNSRQNLQLALMLRYSWLPAYLCKYAGSFLCDNHLENMFINPTICNVFFNNAQKLVNSQVQREVIQQFKKRQGKRRHI